ncbi:DUF1634 domain-containing protein [Yersinia aleksiciae]|uniref:DUF1634 domain-containing protein n=1 Tax=Yersinia aleksiciae TaxID=263819 RepID=UPI0011A98D3D|nr:DUF1634 domain-containing protein [Yersinia aleksiciae]HBB6717184.1 DUF1634 domain-containing protein [Serratia marcescens]
MNNFESESNIGAPAIAGLLWYGTWAATFFVILGIGLLTLIDTGYLKNFEDTGYSLMRLGVFIFIILPIARVALMFGVFIYYRDYTYSAISFFVLAMIGLGVLLAI